MDQLNPTRTLRLRAIASSLTLVVAVWFVSPVQVHAQSADSTGGGWAEFALGYGSLHAFSGASGGGPHMDGYSFVFGGGITCPHLHAGVVLDVWQHKFPDGETQTANVAVTASAHYYPSRRGGLFLEGGLGLSDYRKLKGLHGGLLFESADTTYFKGFGLTGTTGIGWDVQIGSTLAISPRVTYLYGAPRTLHSPNAVRVATGSTQHMLEVSVAFVGHAPNVR
jgi:hypothetical protein